MELAILFMGFSGLASIKPTPAPINPTIRLPITSKGKWSQLYARPHEVKIAKAVHKTPNLS
jgi:hypothetical protein